MARQLPPGVSEESFLAALAAFTEIVGEKWVVSHEAELAKYADPYPVGADFAAGPSAVVSPARTVSSKPPGAPRCCGRESMLSRPGALL